MGVLVEASTGKTGLHAPVAFDVYSVLPSVG